MNTGSPHKNRRKTLVSANKKTDPPHMKMAGTKEIENGTAVWEFSRPFQDTVGVVELSRHAGPFER